MSDIFISYSNEDKERVRPLVRLLEEQGWTVWWDRKIPPGKTFAQVIEEAIEQARCVLVVWSVHSVKSDWVTTEAAEGVRREILVPILIDEVPIPLEFRRIQAAKLTDLLSLSKSHELHELLDSISVLIGKPVGSGTDMRVEAKSQFHAEEKLDAVTKAVRKAEQHRLRMAGAMGLLVAVWVLIIPAVSPNLALTNFLVIPFASLIFTARWPINPRYMGIGVLAISTLNILSLFFLWREFPWRGESWLAIPWALANAAAVDGLYGWSVIKRGGGSFSLYLTILCLVLWIVIPPILEDRTDAGVFSVGYHLDFDRFVVIPLVTMTMALLWPMRHQQIVVVILLLHALNGLLSFLLGGTTLPFFSWARGSLPLPHWLAISALTALCNAAIGVWIASSRRASFTQRR